MRIPAASVISMISLSVQAAPEPWSGANVGQWLGVLLGVLLFAVIMLLLLRRLLAGHCPGSGTELRPLATLPLGIKEKLVLVQVGPKRQLLLGLTPGRIETLLVLEEDACIAPGAIKESSGFASNLQELMGRGYHDDR